MGFLNKILVEKALASLLQTVMASMGLRVSTNFMAEWKAIIHGVKCAASNGWIIAWVESDSTAAVMDFTSGSIPWSLIGERNEASHNMIQNEIFYHLKRSKLQV
ncbi:hypothetical protein GIB67_037760 [Kingdonia uniflora]|uniref:RNase H type-1 domain-containing protein n=1 Tax=Kingdonia uniflora TaxID=39325 RepID=A0A7J7LV95_9MAGN|nr:hypothetical protein GIB67_037760 [Kingdonia uniflora]